MFNYYDSNRIFKDIKIKIVFESLENKMVSEIVCLYMAHAEDSGLGCVQCILLSAKYRQPI
jgi:hypothetical protein